jgi:hypothetical protein
MASTRSTLTCPDEGRLRAHIDVADDMVRTHAGRCGACAARLDGLRAAARFAARAIADLDDGAAVDVDAAWAVRPHRAAPVTGDRSWSRAATGIAAALVALLVATLVVVTPTGRQAAADFLSQFRAERLEVVPFDPEEPLAGMEGLAEIAEVELDGAGHQPVADLDEAATVAGFAPTTVAGLPDGADIAQVMASPPSTARLTFRSDLAGDLPDDLDGAQLLVRVPGAVVTTYALGDGQLYVAESDQLVVEARGADLADIRGYVLSRPEVPPSLARQLLAIDDWTATLPVPVPVDSDAWRETTVGGHPGLVIEDTVGAGVLWHDGDRIHAVGGVGVEVDEVTRIADSVGG